MKKPTALAFIVAYTSTAASFRSLFLEKQRMSPRFHYANETPKPHTSLFDEQLTRSRFQLHWGEGKPNDKAKENEKVRFIQEQRKTTYSTQGKQNKALFKQPLRSLASIFLPSWGVPLLAEAPNLPSSLVPLSRILQVPLPSSVSSFRSAHGQTERLRQMLREVGGECFQLGSFLVPTKDHPVSDNRLHLSYHLLNVGPDYIVKDHRIYKFP